MRGWLGRWCWRGAAGAGTAPRSCRGWSSCTRGSSGSTCRAGWRSSTCSAASASRPASSWRRWTMPCSGRCAARARSERESLEQRLTAQKNGARASELRQAKARVDSARAALAAEEARLARSVLRAPAAGVVLDTTAESGEVLAAGTPAVILGETRRPYLDVFVAQQDLAGVRVGAAAAVRVDAARETFRGTVSDVARTTEFTPRYLFSPRERANLVVRVRIDVEDPREELHAGVPALARIERTPQPSEARR